MAIGDLLRGARTTKGESQGAAADALGVTRVTYNMWEKGVYQPTTEKLRAIADYCDVSVGVILRELGILDEVEEQALILVHPTAQAKGQPNFASDPKPAVGDKQRKRRSGEGARLRYPKVALEQGERVAAAG